MIFAKRLKIARIDDLNDPFELLAQDLSEPYARGVFLRTKKQASSCLGFLCFSNSYRNPLMWSHYADRHRGMCLGFDVDAPNVLPVNYSSKRPNNILSCLRQGVDPSQSEVIDWLQTKFQDWRYEEEVRSICPLGSAQYENGLYFSPFSNHLRLRKVILGVACTLDFKDVQRVAASCGTEVAVFQGTLAGGTFDIICSAVSVDNP